MAVNIIEPSPASQRYTHRQNSLPSTNTTSSRATAIFVGQHRPNGSNLGVRPPTSDMGGQGGTVNSNASGSGSGGSSSTVTSKYLSAGMDIMERIRERKFSESSGTMTGPEHELEAGSSSSGKEKPSSSTTTTTAAADLRRSQMASIRAEANELRSRRSHASASSSSGSSLGKTGPVSLTNPSRPSSLAPPPGTQEDLNRFMSSTTATATHRTNTTAASFVKHRGPSAKGKARGLQSMGPQDIPPMPHQVGKMVFDPQQLKWVRTPARQGGGFGTVVEEGESSEGSVDPFAGLESLRDDIVAPSRRLTTSPLGSPPAQLARVAAESALTPPELEIEAAPSSSESMDEESIQGVETDVDRPTPQLDEELERRLESQHLGEHVPCQSRPDGGRTPSRSTAPREPVAMPPSAMKKALKDLQVEGLSDSASKRNVSFSEGRKPHVRKSIPAHYISHQKTRSDENVVLPEDDVFQSFVNQNSSPNKTGPVPQSARTRRIRGLLDAIEQDTDGELTPTKPRTRSPGPISNQSSSSTVDEVSDSGRMLEHSRRLRNKRDATFLTECSFAVSHDKLVELITEVQPFEPYWEDLTVLDLSKRGATSVARLKEFLPKLDEINLNDNKLNYLSGVPKTVRSLFAAGNKISSLTSVNHLSNLQYLDLSRNDLDSVNGEFAFWRNAK